MTRIIGDQSYRQTKSGIWRKVNAFGEFFLQTSKRPDYVLTGWWKQMQRQSAAVQKRGLATLEQILQKNADELPNPDDPEDVRQLKESKQQADKIANAKFRKIRFAMY